VREKYEKREAERAVSFEEKGPCNAGKEKSHVYEAFLEMEKAAYSDGELADMVSEVKEIKHHYAAGIKDRTGIEY